MRDVRGSTSGMGKRSSSSTSTLGLRRKLVPFSEWMENFKRHDLLLQLPNFKKREVKVAVNDSAGHVTISGEWQVNEENEYGSSKEEDDESEFSEEEGDESESSDEGSSESGSSEEEDDESGSSEEEDDESESSDEESSESGPSEEDDDESVSFEEEDDESESSDEESSESGSSEEDGDESESFEEEEEEESESSDEESSESESSEDEMYFEEIKNKFKYVEEKFTIPPDSDVNKITSKFEGETLPVSIPKVGAGAAEKEKKESPEPEVESENIQGAATENEKGENKNVQGLLGPENDEHNSNKLLGNGHVFFSVENIRKWDEHEDGVLRTAMEMLSKNKGMFLTVAGAAVVAFLLGMLVSHQRFQAGGGE